MNSYANAIFTVEPVALDIDINPIPVRDQALAVKLMPVKDKNDRET